ncbi:sulfotransferase [Nonomuraea rhizosphaerae]|uniref:sulfotransferase n=1 Tax=Nonomuraea rhizosphaerae TaxID=2665663 RepID=UPI0027E3295A|nr:sulfotransferase [Nonomuraea rhizosphaerae]
MTHPSTATRVIYLAGLGRSGTTLLERLLGELPGVAPLGEVVHLWARGVLAGEPCGCGEPFPQCPFWREVGDSAFGGWTRPLAERVLTLRHRVDRTRRITHICHPDLDEYARYYRRLYDAAAAAAGVRVVVDSGKHASLAFCLAAAGVDVDVVHVVRDPRAVAHSWRRNVVRPEDGSPMTRWGAARTAVHWMAQNSALEFLATRDVPVTRVRYEDLMADPEPTLARLGEELGLIPRRFGTVECPAPRVAPAACAVLTERAAQATQAEHGEPEERVTFPFLSGTTAHLTTAHTASGNPMRFTVGRVRLRRDDSWRSGLPRRHRWLVGALTWPLRPRYGYGFGEVAV